MKGTIKRLVADKNFGFIGPENEPKDVFFHANELAAGTQFTSLNVGDVVEFEVVQSEKGPKAVNVSKV